MRSVTILRALVVSGALALGLGLGLAGCSFPPSPHPTSVGTHHATAIPTATPAALSAPRSAIPAGCARLLPTATAVGAFPAASGIAVRVSETSAPDGLIEVSAKQAGGLHCVWGGTNRTDNGYDDMITLDVLTDAADAFHSNVVPNTGDEVNTFGTASDLFCQGDPQFGCYGQVLVGTTWFELDYVSLGGEGEPASGAIGRFHTLLTGVVTAIQGAGPSRSLWTPPAAWDGASLCADDELARARTATGAADLQDGDFSIEGPLTASSAALARVTIQSCGWARDASSGVTSFGVQFVQGGAWAVTQELADPPSYYNGTLAPVTIPGATSALAVCNDAICEADLAVAGSWMSVQVDGLDSVAALVHDISALLAATPH
jgi:hypothetical protein